MGRTKRKYRVTNGEPVGKAFLLPTVKLGNFTANNLRLEEACINDLVLRVELSSALQNMTKTEDAKAGISGVRVRRRADLMAPRKAFRRMPFMRPVKPGVIKNGAVKVQRRKQLLIPKPLLQNLRRNDLARNGVLKMTRKPTRIIPKIAAVETARKVSVESNPAKTAKKTAKSAKPPQKKKYRIVFPPNTPKSPPTCHFNWQLLYVPERLCQLTLPSPAWCVNLVRTNNQTPITFSILNKVQQRGVIFNRKNDLFSVIVRGQPVKLLGCPSFVYTINDLEILVGIVHKLKLDDCMLMKLKE